MIEINDAGNDPLIEIKITAKLTEADFEHLEPVLKKQVAETPDPRLLLVMHNFSGWESAGAFWKDLQLDSEYIGDFDRIALVGDAEWEKWMTKLLDPVTSPDMKYYSTSDITHARKWLQQ